MNITPRIFGHGHHLGTKRGDEQAAAPARMVIVKRRWRLGDVIMCEPVCRQLVEGGEAVTFCTVTEYHAVVQCFQTPAPRVMSYPPPDGDGIKIADREIDLDVVTLDHPEHTAKVDAFLAAAGMDPGSLSKDQRSPRIATHPRHEAWARMRLETMGISNEPIVGIVRSPYEAGSARSLPEDVVETLGDRFAKDHQVVYIGATPMRIEPRDGIHNMTGITPDVMSAAALMMNLRVLITVDTGLMHLGGALDVPMVTVMGPTRPDDLATIYRYNTVLDVGRDCSPCYDRGCDDRCMSKVRADDIIELARSRAEHPDTPTIVHHLAR
jgi:hypothetical protein